MFRRMILSAAVSALLVPFAFVAEPVVPPKFAPSKIVHVTVYPSNALVTREVDAPEGTGLFELIVNPLPSETVNSSLYSEAENGIRVLTTRYRQRPIKEDTREEVRKLEAQVKQLHQTGQKCMSDMKVIEQNLQMLTKLEGFTGSTLQHLTDKGLLNADAIITLSKYVMDSRGEKALALVNLQKEMQENQEQATFVQRKLRELTAGSSKFERDAVIVVDKRDRAAGRVKLHYLVNAATWHPLYKLRAVNAKEKEKVQVEYLAAVMQQTGEDWSHVDLTLSTAEPMLNAGPPELKVLAVSVTPRPQFAGNMPNGPSGVPMQPPMPAPNAALNFDKAKQLRAASQQSYNFNNKEQGSKLINDAAALEQTNDLLIQKEEGQQVKRVAGEGPSVTYHLASKLSVPSRNDEQVIEITRLDFQPEYYYKAVPVLTSHVYRLANLNNTSKYVLLPGEATMYLGSDFVGRAELPLVAIGEQFTAGFGVDPQLQVQRQLLDKTRTTQGDNQVWKYEYRILISSYKTEAVKLQLWDRLPHAETEAVGINLGKVEPKLSTDAIYLRENRPHNLLRWDVTVAPARNGEKAMAVNYEFKLELGRQMTIGSLSTNRAEIGIPLPARRAP